MGLAPFWVRDGGYAFDAGRRALVAPRVHLEAALERARNPMERRFFEGRLRALVRLVIEPAHFCITRRIVASS